MTNSFLIIPAIDLMDGACVRLRQGEAGQKTIYSREPVSVAQRWQQCGARRLHIVDLDGAFEGSPKNFGVIADICRTVKMDVEVGGGLRSVETIERVLEAGARWAVIGTRALAEPEFLDECVTRFPGRIIAGVDARDGIVALKGWKEQGGKTVAEMIPRIEQSGCAEIIYTDIGRDGMLTGPNLESLAEVAGLTRMNVIASGGVARMDDFKALRELGRSNISGAITGKAIYEETLDLREAIDLYQVVSG